MHVYKIDTDQPLETVKGKMMGAIGVIEMDNNNCQMYENMKREILLECKQQPEELGWVIPQSLTLMELSLPSMQL